MKTNWHSLLKTFLKNIYSVLCVILAKGANVTQTFHLNLSLSLSLSFFFLLIFIARVKWVKKKVSEIIYWGLRCWILDFFQHYGFLLQLVGIHSIPIVYLFVVWFFLFRFVRRFFLMNNYLNLSIEVSIQKRRCCLKSSKKKNKYTKYF